MTEQMIEIVMPDGWELQTLPDPTDAFVQHRIRREMAVPGYGLYGHVQPAWQSADGSWYWCSFMYQPSNKDATFGWYAVRQVAGVSSLIWTQRYSSGSFCAGISSLWAFVSNDAGGRAFLQVPGFSFTGNGQNAPTTVDAVARDLAHAARAIATQAQEYVRQVEQGFDGAIKSAAAVAYNAQNDVARLAERVDAVAKQMPNADFVNAVIWNTKPARDLVFDEINRQLQRIADYVVPRVPTPIVDIERIQAQLEQVIALNVTQQLEQRLGVVETTLENMAERVIDNLLSAKLQGINKEVDQIAAQIAQSATTEQVQELIQTWWNNNIGTWDDAARRWNNLRDPVVANYTYNRLMIVLERRGIVTQADWKRVLPERYQS